MPVAGTLHESYWHVSRHVQTCIKSRRILKSREFISSYYSTLLACMRIATVAGIQAITPFY